MKLSTFCKLVKKEYLQYGSPTQQAYVCNVTDALAKTLSYKHPKQSKQYINLSVEVKNFIQVQISPEQTVVNYLAFVQKIKSNFDNAHKFRLAMIEDMIDWAEASESSN